MGLEDQIKQLIQSIRSQVEAELDELDDLSDLVDQIDGTPPGEPPPDTPPAFTWDMQVTENPRVNVRCFEMWNDDRNMLIPKRDGAGKPIMVIYQKPGTGDTAAGRIQYAKGRVVRVYQEVTIGTGGERFHRVYLVLGEHGEKLYLPKASLMKLA
jgi:hypothetical protein